MRSLTVIFFILFLNWVSCATVKNGPFEQDGFHHALFPYTVKATTPGKLVPSEWRLDNYEVDQQGAPLRIKSDPKYLIQLPLSKTQADEPERTEDYPLYDLRFVQNRDQGVIWLRTLPYPHQLNQLKFRSLVYRFVDTMTNKGDAVAKIADRKPTGIERHFNLKVIAESEAVVSGNKAYAVLVEKISLADLEPSENDTREYLELIFVRTEFIWVPKTGKRAFPVFLVAYYSNTQTAFETERPTFEQLIRNLRIESYRKLSESLQRQILACSPDSKRITFTITRREKRKDFRNGVEYLFGARTSGMSQGGRQCLVRALQDDTETQVGQMYVVEPPSQKKTDYATKLPVLQIPAPVTADSQDEELIEELPSPSQVDTAPKQGPGKIEEQWLDIKPEEGMELDEDPEIYEIDE